MWRYFALLGVALLLSGCAFVTLSPGGQRVQVLTGAPAGCQSRGEIVVTMTHRVGFYERDALRVRDELEILARNQAVQQGANRINLLRDDASGRQRWALWRCP